MTKHVKEYRNKYGHPVAMVKEPFKKRYAFAMLSFLVAAALLFTRK